MALAFTALLVAAAPTMAAQGTVELDSALPIQVTGDRVVSANDGAFLLTGDTGDLSLLIEGEQGTLTRVLHRAYGVINQNDPQAGVLWEQRVERQDLPLDGAIVSLAERRDGFQFFAHDGAIQVHDGNAATPLHMGVLASPKSVQSEAEPPIQLILGRADSAPFLHVLRSGLFESRSLDGRMTTDNAALYLSGAVLDYRGADGSSAILRAHFREETHPGAVFDPLAGRWTGPGDHTEYVHEYIEFQLDAGRIQLQHRGVPATLFASNPVVQLTGSAHFPDSNGRIAITGDDGATHELDGDNVDVAGRFQFQLTGTSDGRTRANVAGDGDIVGVTYRATTHEYDWTAVAVAGISALLLGAIAWITGAGKWLIGSMGAFVGGYARVQGDAVLQHDGRQQVYDLVQAEPGMHFMDMCERLPFGASTLNYHLRVLERNEFVSRVKDGRYVRFFDRRTGDFAGDRKAAVSTLRNDTTAAIADCIVQNPGIAQRDLAHAFGIAASTVSWHVERLQKSGLVDKQRDAHFTRYYMGDAWTSLPSNELARFGIAA